MNRPRPSSTIFPYTTLFRSAVAVRAAGNKRGAGSQHRAGAAKSVANRVAARVPRAFRARGRALVHRPGPTGRIGRSEEHTSELQSHSDLVCRLLLEKKKKTL